MSSVTFADHPWLVPDRPRKTGYLPFRKGVRVAGLAYSALLGIVLLDTRPAAGPGCTKPAARASVAAATSSEKAPAPAAPVRLGPNPLLDPAPAAGLTVRAFADAAPLAATFQVAVAIQPSVVVADVEQDDDTAIPPPASTSPLVGDIPLPTPRPADLVASRLASLEPAPAARGSFRTAGRPAVTAAATPDNRSFFERIFGVQSAPSSVLAYAAPEDGLLGGMRRALGAPSTTAGYGPNTAVYDIAAHTVYMPDGTRLEAHSGLRDRLDDPRYVHERMRGATPPSTYDLRLREALFHGVQALRLTPVSGNVFGRTGLLAHTYMLGPNGDSNGCVSFRNYKAFLQAYLNGDVRRLVVVARLI
jgi:hypothetical protein